MLNAARCVTPPPNGLGKTKIAINIEVDNEANQRVATLAENAKPLAEHGTNQYLVDNSGRSNHNVQRGENAEYLTARIARDRPDILSDMKQGKYKSVRAAAIDAEIAKRAERQDCPNAVPFFEVI